MTEPTFAGFDNPKSNFSVLPHQLIDSLSDLKTLSELKVVLYILRHTWGYQEYEDWDAKMITTDEFMDGRKRRDGTRIDTGTGLSKPSIYSGLDNAVAHGFLMRYIDNLDRGRITHYYRLRMEGDPTGDVYAADPERPVESPWHNIDEAVRKAVYAKFEGRCAYCEAKSSKWHFDHIVPRAQGGPDDIENLALACPICNLVKNDRTPDQWGKQVVFYENDVKQIYRGWERFFTSPGKDSLPRTEKETPEINQKKESSALTSSAVAPPIPEKSAGDSAANTSPADAATSTQEKPQGNNSSKLEAKTEPLQVDSEKSPPSSAPPPAPDPTFSAETLHVMAVILRKDPKIKAHDKAIRSTLGQIRPSGPITPGLLNTFRCNWEKLDFRGQKGQAPEPRQLVDKWAEYTSLACEEGTNHAEISNRNNVPSGIGAPGLLSAQGPGSAPLADEPSRLTDEDRRLLAASRQRAESRSLSDLLRPKDSGLQRPGGPPPVWQSVPVSDLPDSGDTKPPA